MLRSLPTYPAAYVHQQATADAEIALLIQWLGSPAKGIAVVAPGKPHLKHSELSAQLIRAGATGLSAAKRPIGPVRGKSVLALWLDDKQLAQLEAGGPARMALAPWVLDESALWQATRSPVELLGASVPQRAQSDPVVRAAIRTVARLSNPANGLTGNNKNYVVNALRILRKAGYTWDPLDTAVIMAEGGWDLDDAREFEALSAAMLAGKAMQAGKSQFAPNILKQWRDEAARA